MNDLEQYLKDTRPVVKDDPTFILETQRRMEAVEGIKGEVDRQRRHGRRALIVALCAGLVIGAAVTAIAFFYPAGTDTVGQGSMQQILAFLQSNRKVLMLPTALLAIALALVLFKGLKDKAFI
ncbi:MAG: hypothetical protein K6E37_10390 [Bacteroidales bacterium]|nr:hypothetical protein [Bacteroidales bacterium]